MVSGRLGAATEPLGARGPESSRARSAALVVPLTDDREPNQSAAPAAATATAVAPPRVALAFIALSDVAAARERCSRALDQRLHSLHQMWICPAGWYTVQCHSSSTGSNVA